MAVCKSVLRTPHLPSCAAAAAADATATYTTKDSNFAACTSTCRLMQQWLGGNEVVDVLAAKGHTFVWRVHPACLQHPLVIKTHPKGDVLKEENLPVFDMVSTMHVFTSLY